MPSIGKLLLTLCGEFRAVPEISYPVVFLANHVEDFGGGFTLDDGGRFGSPDLHVRYLLQISTTQSYKKRKIAVEYKNLSLKGLFCKQKAKPQKVLKSEIDLSDDISS